MLEDLGQTALFGVGTNSMALGFGSRDRLRVENSVQED